MSKSTADNLAEIREWVREMRDLESRATTGPWVVSEMPELSGGHQWCEFGPETPDVCVGEVSEHNPDFRADGELLCRSRNALPALLEFPELLAALIDGFEYLPDSEHFCIDGTELPITLGQVRAALAKLAEAVRP